MGSNPACPTKPINDAAVAALNAALLASDSATETLERRVAGGPLTATRLAGRARRPDRLARRWLATEMTRFRHVRLGVGAVTLSIAENWYAPGLLTAAMNEALEHTSEPFGRVVAPLRCTRRTLAVRVPRVGPAVLEHRAVLLTGSGAVLAVLRERYMPDAVGEEAR